MPESEPTRQGAIQQPSLAAYGSATTEERENMDDLAIDRLLEALKEWDEHVDARDDLSDVTKRTYKYHARRFVEWLAAR